MAAALPLPPTGHSEIPGRSSTTESARGPVGDLTGSENSQAAPSGDESNLFLDRFASDTWREEPRDAASTNPDLIALVAMCPPWGDEYTETGVSKRTEKEWSPVALARFALFKCLVEKDGPGWPHWALARTIWERSTSPFTRALLFCKAELWENGEWWNDPTFAAQALEAVHARKKGQYLPIATWHARGRLRFLDWARGARCWAPRTWVGLLKCATDDLRADRIEEYLEAYASSGAAAMPKDVLTELLADAPAKVRVWAQCELSRHGDGHQGTAEPVGEGPAARAQDRQTRSLRTTQPGARDQGPEGKGRLLRP